MPTLEKSELFFAEKPNGISSHRPSADHQGFAEWCEQQINQKLYVCHRLDKETSGAMVFAKSKLAATQLTELFSTQQVQKTYLFVSDKKSKFENWVVCEDKAEGTLLLECPLQKEEVGYQSFTEFVRISSDGPLYLYKAFPKTGKTHQIRKHALHSRIAILGDDQYQGKSFARLMLHCLEMKINGSSEEIKLTSKPSRLFDDLNLCTDSQLAGWIDSYERREKVFAKLFEDQESLRLFHSETGDLRGEKVGDVVILGWWKSEQPTEDEKAKIQKLMGLLNIKNWVFQWRPGAQDKQSTEVLLKGSEFKSQDWLFHESGLKYRGSLERGQNFGLFLELQKMIQENNRLAQNLNKNN
ncbi:MAG: pseudouridine synthase [Pseudomonadota bacterium]